MIMCAVSWLLPFGGRLVRVFVGIECRGRGAFFGAVVLDFGGYRGLIDSLRLFLYDGSLGIFS